MGLVVRSLPRRVPPLRSPSSSASSASAADAGMWIARRPLDRPHERERNAVRDSPSARPSSAYPPSTTATAGWTAVKMGPFPLPLLSENAKNSIIVASFGYISQNRGRWRERYHLLFGERYSAHLTARTSGARARSSPRGRPICFLRRRRCQRPPPPPPYLATLRQCEV